MKIAMLDLSHATLGVTINSTPLASGNMAGYLRGALGEACEFRIYKSADEALQDAAAWKPDLLTLSQYCWNSRLNLHVAQAIKRRTGAFVVAGGPNLELEDDKKAEFLRRFGHVIDLCVEFDGEIPLHGVVARLLAGESRESILAAPGAGTYALDPAGKTLVKGEGSPPKLRDLDVFGAVYADGHFDHLLDQGYFPLVQTHRGCPFHCTYCHTSDTYYDKVIFQSPQVFRRDIEHLARFFAGKPHAPLYLANANMSLFDQDFAIAKIMREMQQAYGWPMIINCNSGKNPNKLLEMLSIIDFEPGIALQTLTKDVLKNVKRVNIPFEDYMQFQQKVMQRKGVTSSSELILSLPGETERSFEDTLHTIIDSGVQDICIYTLMSLSGTPLASQDTRRRYTHDVRYRLVPRSFTKIGGEVVLEPEAVVVGTADMPYEHYLRLRGLAVVIEIFLGSQEFFPIRRLLAQQGLSVADWIAAIHGKVSGLGVFSVYDGFMRETEAELHESSQALEEFFRDEANYQALVEGRLGDNLMRKYKFVALYHTYGQCLDLAVQALRETARIHPESGITPAMVDSVARYCAFRDLKQLHGGDTPFAGTVVELNYDVPGWMASCAEGDTLADRAAPGRYAVACDASMPGRLAEAAAVFKDFDLSMQILYRDRRTNAFWPDWTPLASA